jgi:hypothetical protein
MKVIASARDHPARPDNSIIVRLDIGELACRHDSSACTARADRLRFFTIGLALLLRLRREPYALDAFFALQCL